MAKPAIASCPSPTSHRRLLLPLRLTRRLTSVPSVRFYERVHWIRPRGMPRPTRWENILHSHGGTEEASARTRTAETATDATRRRDSRGQETRDRGNSAGTRRVASRWPRTRCDPSHAGVVRQEKGSTPRLRCHPGPKSRFFASSARPRTSRRSIRALLRRRSTTSPGRRTVLGCRDRMDCCLCSVFLRSFGEGGCHVARATNAHHVVVATRFERRKTAIDVAKTRAKRAWIRESVVRGAGGDRGTQARTREAKDKLEKAPAGAREEAAREKKARPRVVRDVRLVDREARTNVVQASGCNAVDVAICTWNRCTVKTK